MDAQSRRVGTAPLPAARGAPRPLSGVQPAGPGRTPRRRPGAARHRPLPARRRPGSRLTVCHLHSSAYREEAEACAPPHPPAAAAGGGGGGRGYGRRRPGPSNPPPGCPGAAPRIRLFLPARHLRWGSRRGPYVPGRRRGEGLRLVAAAAAPAPPRRQGPGAGAAATGLCALLLRGDRRCRREGQGCERPGRLGPPSLFYFFIFFFSGGKKKKKPNHPNEPTNPKKP